MIRYAAGRVVAIVPVLFGVSIVVFLLIRLIPGNPAISILGERATPELVERVRNQLGLDLPIWRQYLHFLGNASRGDFGARTSTSRRSRRSRSSGSPSPSP